MRFSIIIPLYNKEPYVLKAIHSVLDQTFKDYELIIVDDGSIDNSAAIAKHVIDGYDNCYLIKQKNAGVSRARNKGVEVSHGEYICFLDADDWWEPTFLEDMAGLIKRYPNAGIYGTGYYIVKNGIKRLSTIGVDNCFTEGYINYCQVYATKLAMPFCTDTVCIPRIVYDEHGGFNNNIDLGEDFELWVRIALTQKVVLLNLPLANYNQDVDPTYRGTHRGKHHPRNPDKHYLWNLGDLEDEEKRNKDFKILIDKLRAYALMNYYLDRKFRSRAKTELAKIDWDTIPINIKIRYKLPVFIIKFNRLILSSLLKKIK